MSAPELAIDRNVHPNAEVFTQDGHRLGRVGAVLGSSFEVRSPYQRFWLPLAAVTSATPMHVIVAFYADQWETWARGRAA